MNSDTVKALALQYWRYDKQAPVVALEYDNSDVICIHRGYIVETEVKVSIADLRRDLDKSTHCWIRRLLKLPVEESRYGTIATQYAGREYETTYLSNCVRQRSFYFAVPEAITEKALPIVEELYPYAGLLSAFVSDMPSSLRYGGVNVVKLAALLPVKKLDFREVRDLVKAQSATLTRLALKVGRDKMAQIVPPEAGNG